MVLSAPALTACAKAPVTGIDAVLPEPGECQDSEQVAQDKKEIRELEEKVCNPSIFFCV